MTEITPFHTDPQVMAKIFPMQESDAEEVAQQHFEAMGNSLWAKLGYGFLKTLYRLLLQDPDFLAYVYKEDGCVKGFAAGSLCTEKTFKRTLKRGFWELLGAGIKGAAMHPQALPYLAATPFYFSRSSDPSLADQAAESLFCSFKPELRGRRVSGHINKVIFEAMRSRGFRYIKVTTEKTNAAAIRQLEHWGFEVIQSFNFYGKDMLTYIMDTENNIRISKS